MGDGVFTYALIDFWSRYAPDAVALSLEAIAHTPGGPGRVYLLDENDVGDRLAALDDITDGALRWSETAGLKRVYRTIDVNEGAALERIQCDYAGFSGKRAV